MTMVVILMMIMREVILIIMITKFERIKKTGIDGD